MDIGNITGMYTDYAKDLMQSSNKTGKLDSLKNQDLSNASEEKLMDVCKEFEAYFMEMVMKEMTKTLGEDEGGSSSAMVNYFKDTTIADIAKKGTEQQSLGLAQTLFEQMKRNYGLDS